MTGPVFPPQNFSGRTASYTFTFGGACPMQPAAIVTEVTANHAQLTSATFSTIRQEISSLNASSLSTLAVQISSLSTLVSTETAALSTMATTAVGNMSLVLGQVSNQATANQATGTQLTHTNAVLSATLSSVQSTATANSGLVNALRNAVIAAATNTPTLGVNGTLSVPTLESNGNMMSLTSGACYTGDVCGATYFAANLRTALAAL